MKIIDEKLFSALVKLANSTDFRSALYTDKHFPIVISQDMARIIDGDLAVEVDAIEPDDERDTMAIPASALKGVAGITEINFADDRAMILANVTKTATLSDSSMILRNRLLYSEEITEETSVNIDTLQRVSLPAKRMDEWRPTLRSVCFDRDQVASTSGFALNHAPLESPLEGSYIVPLRAIKAALTLAKVTKDTSLGVWFGERYTVINGTGWTVRTENVGAQFPDWRPLIPTSFRESVTFDSKEMLTMLRSVPKVGKRTPMIMDGETFTVTTPDGDEWTATVQSVAATCDAEPCSVAFNPKYLTDTVKACAGKGLVTIKWSGELNPALFTSADSNVSAVLMPVRTS